MVTPRPAHLEGRILLDVTETRRIELTDTNGGTERAANIICHSGIVYSLFCGYSKYARKGKHSSE